MPLMDWIKRWNFIERARYERQLIEAFGRGEDIDALAANCEPGFQKGGVGGDGAAHSQDGADDARSAATAELINR